MFTQSHYTPNVHPSKKFGTRGQYMALLFKYGLSNYVSKSWTWCEHIHNVYSLAPSHNKHSTMPGGNYDDNWTAGNATP